MNRPYDRRRRSGGGSRGGRGIRSGLAPRSRVANSQINDNTPVPAGLVFYCKSCESIIDFHPETFNFKLPQGLCPQAVEKAARVGAEAPTKPRPCEIVYGTERSIKHYFKIPDSKFDAQRRADEERAAKADKL